MWVIKGRYLLVYLNNWKFSFAGICNCRKFSNSDDTCGCKIQSLQHLQNNAARVVQQAWRQDHIAPVLHDLHWLPVTQRVQYKILTIVFK